MTNHQPKTSQELRKFGLTMTVPLALIGGLMLRRGRESAPYVLCLAAYFLLASLLVPRTLTLVERLWMAFGRRMSVGMTYVILTLAFYLVITPFGCLLRLFGKDLLQLKFDRQMTSYWGPVESDGPCSRPDKPY